jgi:iron-sulfur cluster insertion protein
LRDNKLVIFLIGGGFMLEVTERAAEFYKEEMSLKNGEAIRLFVRYGGGGLDGFTLGVEKGDVEPNQAKVVVNGISFYNHPEDDWLVDLAHIDTNDTMEDIKLSFKE